jgi:pilus assembly protein Flp/PilA
MVLRQIIILKGISIMFMLFAPKERGQGLVEYAIILALIAIVVIGIMGTLGKKVNNTFNSIGASMTM